MTAPMINAIIDAMQISEFQRCINSKTRRILESKTPIEDIYLIMQGGKLRNYKGQVSRKAKP